jgi:hypothetical protein
MFLDDLKGYVLTHTWRMTSSGFMRINGRASTDVAHA